MNLLLDTHAWLWFSLGDPQLSATAQSQILDPQNQIFLSPVSYWEISIKISLGKYQLNVPYAKFMQDSIQGNGFHILQILPKHTEHLLALPFHHRDPFDRLIVSQAMEESMSLVSNDAQFDSYGIPRIW